MKKGTYLTIRKVGKFYQTFDEDANILHYLFSYKIVNHRAGFPFNALNKVLNTLEEKKISYIIVDDENPSEMDFKDLNEYEDYVSKSMDKIEIEKKLKHLDLKLSKMNSKQLLNVLNEMEEFVEDEARI